MSFEEYAKKRHSVPYVLRLKAGRGRLLYFGARHVSGSDDPELAQIERLWAEFKPRVAFFEGADPESMPTPARSRAEVRGESGLVLFLAARDKVPVRTLEPSQRDEVALLLGKYSPEEVKVFYVLRQVPQFRSGAHAESVEAYTENVLGGLSLRPELRGAPRTVAELKASCARLFPQLPDWRDVPQAWFDPVPLPPPTYLNDVSRRLSELRDRHMLSLLAEEVSKGKRVFAVVGASHVVMQERALRAEIKAARKTR
ncbi:MAG: TraB/GumN family protein [Acidobacteriota bacterium]|nr:TraB/GumN family protein [Acidobacteriota bacterium]